MHHVFLTNKNSEQFSHNAMLLEVNATMLSAGGKLSRFTFVLHSGGTVRIQNDRNPLWRIQKSLVPPWDNLQNLGEDPEVE